MNVRPLPLLLFCATTGLWAQSECPPTALYTPCDIVFELDEAEAKAHPNPFLTVDLRAEFRSPRHRTFLIPAFWDGGRRMVIRFSPTGEGAWDYRVSGNLARFDNKTGAITATAAPSPAMGFIRAANVHHFAHTDDNRNVPHLWMGDTVMNFGFMDGKAFEDLIEARSKQKYNHIRGAALIESMFPAPDRVDPEKFKQLDERIRAINSKGLIADLILGEGNRQITRLFPNWQERARYLKYVVSRYAAMNVTWQIVDAFEDYENGRDLMKELGPLLKKLDPYGHPRSTGARATSAPLLEDGWMDHILYRSDDDQLGAIEHQLYGVPAVNLGGAANVDADTYRRRIWNAAMNGQYISLRAPESGEAFAAAFYDFFAASRHWDLEPYFDVDGGRAVALDDVEYVVYVEKPGPVEIAIQKRGYNIAWYNPRTGEFLKQKDFKGDKFIGGPPDKSSDWVLRVSREERKADMLRSYRFEARAIILQEVEQSAARIPFEIAQPLAESIRISVPPAYEAKLKRETRATRSMMWLWTGEVAADQQGYRVLGTGAKGTLRIPAGMVKKLPAVMHLRLTGMNANGKVYQTDRIVQLTQ